MPLPLRHSLGLVCVPALAEPNNNIGIGIDRPRPLWASWVGNFSEHSLGSWRVGRCPSGMSTKELSITKRVDLVWRRRVDSAQSPDWVTSDLLPGSSLWLPVDRVIASMGEQGAERRLEPQSAVILAEVVQVSPLHRSPGIQDGLVIYVREMSMHGEGLKPGPAFRILTWGVYSANVAQLAQVGDLLAVENPVVSRETHQRTGGVPWMICVHSRDQGPVTRLAFVQVGCRSSLIRVGEAPLTPFKPSRLARPVDDQVRLGPDPTTEPPVVAQSVGDRIYTPINECTQVKGQYNVWAVITRVSRPVGPTKGHLLMGQVYIQDPECVGTYGLADYQFSLMGKTPERFPPLVVGSVIRIHHMAVQEYNGSLTGRVYDAHSVTTIAGQPGDPIRPECRGPNFTFSEADAERVTQLRIWWQQYQNAAHAQEWPSMEKRFEELERPGEFDVYCRVLQATPFQPEEDSGGPRRTLLTVTDGTRSHLTMLRKATQSQGLRATHELGEERVQEFEILVEDHEDILTLARPTQVVLLMRVQCERKQLRDGADLMHQWGYFFTIKAGQVAKCSVVPENHSKFREIAKRIRCNTQGTQASQDMRSLEELMEEIHRSPRRDQLDHETNMFPHSELFDYLEITRTSQAKVNSATQTKSHPPPATLPQASRDPIPGPSRSTSTPNKSHEAGLTLLSTATSEGTKAAREGVSVNAAQRTCPTPVASPSEQSGLPQLSLPRSHTPANPSTPDVGSYPAVRDDNLSLDDSSSGWSSKSEDSSLSSGIVTRSRQKQLGTAKAQCRTSTSSASKRKTSAPRKKMRTEETSNRAARDQDLTVMTNSDGEEEIFSTCPEEFA